MNVFAKLLRLWLLFLRIFFTGGGTGGHLYPALAIARALVELEQGVRPFFVGAKRGVEREILPGTEFEYVLLDLHPIYRSRPWNNWRTLVGLAGAWRTLGRAAGAGRPAAGSFSFPRENLRFQLLSPSR